MSLRTSCLLASIVTLACACNKSSGDATASSAAASASAAPSASASAAPSASARPQPIFKGRGLAAGFVRLAISLPDVSDDQRNALMAIDDRLKRPMPDPLRDQMRAIHDDMVAGARAGKVDTAKIAAHYDALDKAGDARAELQRAAFTEIHDLLKMSQRRAIVVVLRKRAAETGDEPSAGPDGGPPPDPKKQTLDGMAKDLSLDPGQKAAVGALIAKLPAQEAAHSPEKTLRLRTILATFESDEFDAKKIDLGFVPGKKPHEVVAPYIEFVTKLVALLRPDQREKLGARLDKQHGFIGGIGTYDED